MSQQLPERWTCSRRVPLGEVLSDQLISIDRCLQLGKSPSPEPLSKFLADLHVSVLRLRSCWGLNHRSKIQILVIEAKVGEG